MESSAGRPIGRPFALLRRPGLGLLPAQSKRGEPRLYK